MCGVVVEEDTCEEEVASSNPPVALRATMSRLATSMEWAGGWAMRPSRN